MVEIDPVSRAQAQILVAELERAADALVDELELPGIHFSSAARRRAELVEIRAHIQRLQQRYRIDAATRPAVVEPR